MIFLQLFLFLFPVHVPKAP